MSDRRCAESECGTILAAYNADTRCALHRIDRPAIRAQDYLPDWAGWGNCAADGPVDSLLPDFFADETNDDYTTRVTRAKIMCADCPVRDLCLTWAIEQEDAELRSGIFGGLTPDERDQAVASGDLLDYGAELIARQVASGWYWSRHPAYPPTRPYLFQGGEQMAQAQ